jgi:glutamate synthase domain-containing protein 3
MAGHGTVIADDDGQGNFKVYVNNNGGNQYYQAGSEVWANNIKNLSLSVTNLAHVDWDADSNRLVIISTGSNAVGNVNAGGNKVTITQSGDTGLSNTQVNIDLSGNYGSSNGNFANSQGISVARIGDKVAFLGELNG